MKLIVKQLLYIFFFLLSFQALAQNNDSPLTFDEILFSGNNKTKTSYLRQFVTCKIKIPTYLSNIENDVQQLKNLSSVANASYSIATLEDKTTLTFTIEERRTKLPILNLGGIKNNLWFGVGLIENNFGGRGNQLLAYYQNTDGRHTAEVYFRNPRNHTGKWGYSASLRKWSSIEPLYFNEGNVQYLYDNNSLSFSVIRNLSLQRNIELGGTVFKEKYEQNDEQDLINPPGPQNFEINKFLSKIQFNENKLFYSFFYLKGYSVNLIAQNVFSFFDKSFFNSAEIEAKAFIRPIDGINIGSRFRFAVSTNNDSPFAPFVADSHVNIRVDSDNFRHFVGGGIRVIYQKVFGATIRVDYSFDIYNIEEKGFVIGLGQYF